MNAVKMSDQLGHTWAQIVGADNLSPKPLGDARATVMVASIAGMTAINVHPTALTAMGGEDSGATYADGDETDDAKYNGIDGTVYCLGTDCKVTTDGKLAGSWYFTPTEASHYYRKVGMDTEYVRETTFAQFGYWLSTVGEDNEGAIVINTYAKGGAGTDTNTATTLAWGLNMAPAPTLTDKSATYSGDAVGMSLHKTTDVDGEITSIYSGAFTADVTLKAEFSADAPMLGGTVDNFQGNAVDSTWSVILERTAVVTGAVAAGLTTATGRNGAWSATSYGTDTARPVGIFGGFNAHFSDGHAAGAYATRK